MAIDDIAMVMVVEDRERMKFSRKVSFLVFGKDLNLRKRGI